MKNNRKSFWITAALSGVLLTGLLLVFGIVLPSHPGTSTEVFVTTQVPSVSPSENEVPSGAVSPTVTQVVSVTVSPTATPIASAAASPTVTPIASVTASPTATPKPTGEPNPQLETAAYCLSLSM